MRQEFDIYTRTNQVLVDVTIFGSSFVVAYLTRFDGMPPWHDCKQFLYWFPYLIVLRLLVNWKLGIYRFIWKYVSLSDAIAIARSLLGPTALFLALRLFYPGQWIFGHWLRLPLTVIVLEYALSLMGCLGLRALRRLLYEREQRTVLMSLHGVKRVILYGAGRAGILLLKELQSHAEIRVVGFVDDDEKKVGMVISGVKVLGSGRALEEIVRHDRADEVIISIATAGRKALRQIVSQCKLIPIEAKIIPSLQEIIEGRVSISQLRDVSIEDLLGREIVDVTQLGEEFRKTYGGKRILVTGAGGSIGSELVRQLLPLHPDSVALLDKDENSLYELEQELIFRFPDARIAPQITDIRNARRLSALMAEFKPQVVFHAAAHKHVPLMEKNPCEAVLNNVMGTKILLETCRQQSVERVVFISTDKAVNPTSVMGATKRLGEILVDSYARTYALRCSSVRFGNVMGSRGSVIPLFHKQIRAGGPVTVTHSDVVRYFMTIPEAVQLILCAGTLGGGGEIFVLDMGDPRRILDLANEMIRLTGLEPHKDIEIVITGLRPGEKLMEELTGNGEKLCPTQFEKLMKVNPDSHNCQHNEESIAPLIQAAQNNDSTSILGLLGQMGLGFTPHRPAVIAGPRMDFDE